jgi:ABC-type nickel/cobalt efflux system permease component RcnA
MSLMRLVCLLLLAVCAVWFAVATHAEDASPLFPAPAADNAASQPAAAGGAWQTIGRFVVRAESDFSRELNSHMAAVRRGEGAAALAAGILAAFLYGVFHTLAVGHGKTVVVGYFLGNAARPVHGLLMALWIAVSHVLGAVVVAFLAHWLLRQVTMSPIEQNHWIRMISFGAIALIGASMLAGEWGRLRTGKAATHACAHDHHDHGHHHLDHGHHHGHGARHRGLLAIAAGFVPCSGAILILTFAIANGILVSGLAMVAAIALGMALTLGGLGLASMLVRHQVVFRMAGRGGATRWLGLVGPLLILVMGGLLFLAELSIIVVTTNA